ncbi:hypothetical protein HPB49_015418 [Dermacentor silvarum]|uniref:Uncharacterized protein n=1 Tax=Dermacentor silvarum TaxID=543639 RepID=A0ACB8E0G7_DERSI|nr:hypothetical protein HPB49_015418 [Dermacentor silvarum]
MGSWREPQEWLNAFPNLCLGLTPLVSFERVAPFTDVACEIPLIRLLLETDWPYFHPKKRTAVLTTDMIIEASVFSTLRPPWGLMTTLVSSFGISIGILAAFVTEAASRLAKLALVLGLDWRVMQGDTPFSLPAMIFLMRLPEMSPIDVTTSISDAILVVLVAGLALAAGPVATDCSTGKRAVLQQHLQQQTRKPDIIMIQETHSEETPRLLGHRSHDSPPSERDTSKGKGRGVRTFVRKGVTFMEHELIGRSAIEHCTVEVIKSKKRKESTSLVKVHSNPSHGQQKFKALLHKASRVEDIGRKSAAVIKWFPAHIGSDVSERGNANHKETGNAAARGLTNRVAANTADSECWQLQTGSPLTPVLANHVCPSVYTSDVCRLCAKERATTAHILWDCSVNLREASEKTTIPPQLEAATRIYDQEPKQCRRPLGYCSSMALTKAVATGSLRRT